MVDREKVKDALRRCPVNKCDGCPYKETYDKYGYGCLNEVDMDALELLQEQDKPTRPVFNGRFWECEECGHEYSDILDVKKYSYCPWCGRRISWEG